MRALSQIAAVAPKDAVVVMNQGSRFPQASFITRDNAVTIMEKPGISKSPDGKPAAFGDFYAGVPITESLRDA